MNTTVFEDTQNVKTPRKFLSSESYLTSIKKSLDEGSYIVFDLESTGGNPEHNGITEVCAIRWRMGKEEAKFHSLVNPKRNIPPIVKRITGITNQMVKSAPVIEEVMPKLLEFIGSDILVSHNTISDLKFIQYFSEKVCNHLFSNFFLCTHLLTQKLFPKAPNKSLQGMIKWLELPIDKVHRAEDDAYLTLALFNVILKKLSERDLTTIEEAIRLQGDIGSLTKIGWMIPETTASKLNSQIGLLKFLNKQGKSVWATSTFNQKATFLELSHFKNLPRSLIKTLASAEIFENQSYSNIFEAMLAESMEGSPKSSYFDVKNWHQRAISGIFISSVNKETFSLGMGYVPEGALAFSGPIIDKKQTLKCLKLVAETFKLERVSSSCWRLNTDQVPVFIAWLNQNTDFWQQSKLGLGRKFLLRLIGKGKLLSMQENWLEKLKLIKLPEKMSPLLSLSGLIVSWNKKNKSWELYPVERGVAKDKINCLNHNNWLNHETKKLITSLAKSDKSLEELCSQPLSASEAKRSQVTLWFLKAYKNNSKAIQFYSPQQLKNLIIENQ